MEETLNSKEASLYKKLEGNRVRCHLCSHFCLIEDGKRGICQVRENREGTLYTLVYGRTIAQHVDPIEKKPLYHFYPGSRSFSIATPGCNFRCGWCQNADISQMPAAQRTTVGRPARPEDIVAQAESAACASIAYTYTEPTIFFEYARDTAERAKEAGLANVFVTNGYMSPQALDEIKPVLDAANVDLKSFRDEVYQKHVGARLAPIRTNLVRMKELGVWVEVTSLIIPDINDDPGELREAARFIAQEMGRDTPWHLSRFHPSYEFDHVPPTPVETLRLAAEIGAEEGLHYVYLGNVGGANQTTVCPACNEPVIERRGYGRPTIRLRGAACAKCGEPIAGVGLNAGGEDG